MRIDWGMMLTIFLAIVLARIVTQSLLSGGSTTTSTAVTAMTHSPAQPVVIYTNPIDEYLAKTYPNARR